MFSEIVRGRAYYFHSKGTWGCARKGILFWTSSLAKGILFDILANFSLGNGSFLTILVKEESNFGNSVLKPKFCLILVKRMR